jgi:CheY-like chemotaxis protein/HPt (histidine-containing phosphotransfer) domain-containing protein
VEDLAVLMSEGAQTKGLEIATYVQPTVLNAVIGDADRLRQVLTNLLSNAVKFTETGEVVIRLTLSGTNGRRGLFRFEVVDTGIGIDPRDRGLLFKAFSQIDGSLTRRHGGSGLGLAISQRLVELMGGSLQLDSTPGEGSRFWFELPLELPQGVDSPRICPAEREHVLVVDDNATNRLILEELLSAWKVQHQSAADGSDALKLLEQQHDARTPFTTLALDMQMPGMSGLDVARAVRRDPRYEDLYVVMLTSLGSEVARTEGLEAWADRVLVKPVKQCDLAAALPGLRVGSASIGPRRKPPESVSTSNDLSRGYRILLVEDHPLNQEVMKDMLGSLGYDFDLAANGQLALDALEADDYSLVLMDCQMPVLDGYEATRRWRRLERERDGDRVPIVAVTAHALTDEREKVLQAGMDDLLTKPVQLPTLGEVLAKWLRDAKRFENAPAATDTTADAPSSEAALLDEQTPRSPRMCELFLEHATADLEFIQEAAAIEDAETLRQYAHRLKGSAYTFGAELLGRQAAGVEASAKQGDTDVGVQIAGLLGTFQHTKEKLSSTLEEHDE